MDNIVYKRFLYINSEHRTNGETGDFTVNVDQGQLQNCYYIQPTLFSFTNVFFNVNDNSRIFKIDATTYTLPLGSYTSSGPNSLISAINTLLTLSGIVATFSSLTGKVTFTSATTFALDYIATQPNFLKLVGIRGTELSSFVGPNYVLKGLNIIDLRPETNRLFVHMDMISDHYINNNESVLGSDVLLQMDLASFGEITTFSNPDDSLFRIPLQNGRNLSSFRLRISDEHNITVDTFGAEYQLTLAVVSNDY